MPSFHPSTHKHSHITFAVDTFYLTPAPYVHYPPPRFQPTPTPAHTRHVCSRHALLRSRKKSPPSPTTPRLSSHLPYHTAPRSEPHLSSLFLTRISQVSTQQFYHRPSHTRNILSRFNQPLPLRLTSHVYILTPHASRLTFHVSRIISYVTHTRLTSHATPRSFLTHIVELST